jgi:hypothetical protein
VSRRRFKFRILRRINPLSYFHVCPFVVYLLSLLSRRHIDVLGGLRSKSRRWSLGRAAGTVKLLLPPRQSRGSGRIEARTGLRMMPTFPRSPLRFRTVGFPQYGSKAGLSDRAFPDPASVKLAPSIPVASIRFATTLRALRSSMGSPFSVGATCSVEHRHASDIRRSTPGALAPVQVMLSWTIIT